MEDVVWDPGRELGENAMFCCGVCVSVLSCTTGSVMKYGSELV